MGLRFKGAKELIVVALGGNAFIRKSQKGTYAEQQENINLASKHLADLVEQGYRLVITHGNGPQVGATLLRHEAGLKMYEIPPLPIHVCVAETQGFIGYLIQQALRSELKRRKLDKAVLTVLTRVVIDAKDPRLKNTIKPVGPFYSKADVLAIQSIHPDYAFSEDKGRGGWRRVVPSPNPMRIAFAEQASITTLVDAGFIVITCGGGGIPVIEEKGWRSVGIDAVIDKDLASERLATQIRADRLILLTDTDAVYLDFGKPSQKKLERLILKQAKNYLKEGHFPEGTMAPKITAATRFVESGGKEAIVAEMKDLLKAVAHEAGTRIVP